MTYSTKHLNLKKWTHVVQAKIHRKLGRKTAAATPAEIAAHVNAVGLKLVPNSALPLPISGIPEEIAAHYFAHRFDIFGSGFVPFQNGLEKREWIIAGNQYHFPSEYKGIDWKQTFPVAPGKDIKLPWELGRLQHLPQLSWNIFLGGPGSDAIAMEIEAELHDFSMANPLGEGANWLCAMDVAIRIVNIITAYEILCLAKSPVAKRIEPLLTKLVIEHGRFIFQNLEWYSEGRGNHYLADLCGLLFCASWLSPCKETISWLVFASGELSLEANRQFLPDGSNFEGSVFYHRLSLELLAYSTAVLRCAEKKYRHLSKLNFLSLQSELERILCKAAQFLRDMSDSSDHGIQIGDNDSGSLLKICPRFELEHGVLREDQLDTGRTLSLFDGKGITPDNFILSCIAGKKAEFKHNENLVLEKKSHRVIVVPANHREHYFPFPFSPPSLISHGAYIDFGIYYWFFDSFSAWIRCGKPSGDGHHGHAHFDQLHLELRFEKKCITVDPGSFTYTPDVKLRNFFRGPEAHFIPRLVGQESQADQSVDLFRYPGLPSGECLIAQKNEFVGRYYSDKKEAIYRRVLFESQGVRLQDWAESESPIFSEIPALEFGSNGYGKKS